MGLSKTSTPHFNIVHDDEPTFLQLMKANGTKIERFCSNIDSRHAEGRELGNLRNIRVISLQSYIGISPNELTLKKGQIIKQKLGADEDGFCYGWTRESRFSPKQYGKYPVVIVKAYDSETKTNH